MVLEEENDIAISTSLTDIPFLHLDIVVYPLFEENQESAYYNSFPSIPDLNKVTEISSTVPCRYIANPMVVPSASKFHSTWSLSYSRRPSHYSFDTKPPLLTKYVYKNNTNRRTSGDSRNDEQHNVDLVNTFDGWEPLVPQKLQFDAFDREIIVLVLATNVKI